MAFSAIKEDAPVAVDWTKGSWDKLRKCRTKNTVKVPCSLSFSFHILDNKFGIYFQFLRWRCSVKSTDCQIFLDAVRRDDFK